MKISPFLHLEYFKSLVQGDDLFDYGLCHNTFAPGAFRGYAFREQERTKDSRCNVEIYTSQPFTCCKQWLESARKIQGM
jgi:hypothetical protein